MLIVNMIRLSSTFMIGFVALRLFAGMGAGILAQYLVLLGVRWMIATIANAAEMVALPLVSRGHAHQVAGLSRLAAVLSVVVACLVVGASVQTATLWVLIYSSFWAVVHCLSTPRMARLLWERRHLEHAVLLVLRRSVDLVALALVVLLAVPDDATMTVFLQIGTVILAVASVLLWPSAAQGTPDRATRRDFRRAALISFSQALGLRFPVLLLALSDHKDALPVAVGFVLAGYIRQIATAGINGFDGVVARLSKARFLPVARNALLWHSSVLAMVVLATIGGLPWIFPMLLPVGVSYDPGVIAIILTGVFARCIMDMWIKLLSGRGIYHDIAWITSTSAGLSALGMLAAIQWLEPGRTGPVIALLFLLGQGLSLLVMGLRRPGAATAPSSPSV